MRVVSCQCAIARTVHVQHPVFRKTGTSGIDTSTFSVPYLAKNVIRHRVAWTVYAWMHYARSSLVWEIKGGTSSLDRAVDAASV